MRHHLLSRHAAVTEAAETARHAYNVAFHELGLSWHWDAPTYARLQAQGRNCVQAYLETEQSHLLRAYDADFLVNAIETAMARSQRSTPARQAYAAPYARAVSGQFGLRLV